jgi:hypothetical protein
MRLIVAVACAASQSTSFQLYDNFTGNILFASATAREMAPADARPAAHESAEGRRTATWIAAQEAIEL